MGERVVGEYVKRCTKVRLCTLLLMLMLMLMLMMMMMMMMMMMISWNLPFIEPEAPISHLCHIKSTSYRIKPIAPQLEHNSRSLKNSDWSDKRFDISTVSTLHWDPPHAIAHHCQVNRRHVAIWYPLKRPAVSPSVVFLCLMLVEWPKRAKYFAGYAVTRSSFGFGKWLALADRWTSTFLVYLGVVIPWPKNWVSHVLVIKSFLFCRCVLNQIILSEN